jgi:hypothetical protein
LEAYSQLTVDYFKFHGMSTVDLKRDKLGDALPVLFAESERIVIDKYGKTTFIKKENV